MMRKRVPKQPRGRKRMTWTSEVVDGEVTPIGNADASHERMI